MRAVGQLTLQLPAQELYVLPGPNMSLNALEFSIVGESAQEPGLLW